MNDETSILPQGAQTVVLEQKTGQQLIEEIKKGAILHTSWGYDMTINNYCKVIENTGKTLKCRMVEKVSETFDGFDGTVEPDKEAEFGKEFRLRLSLYGTQDEIRLSIRGSYPFVIQSNGNESKRLGSFRVWNGKANHENHMD